MWLALAAGQIHLLAQQTFQLAGYGSNDSHSPPEKRHTKQRVPDSFQMSQVLARAALQHLARTSCRANPILGLKACQPATIGRFFARVKIRPFLGILIGSILPGSLILLKIISCRVFKRQRGLASGMICRPKPVLPAKRRERGKTKSEVRADLRSTGFSPKVLASLS